MDQILDDEFVNRITEQDYKIIQQKLVELNYIDVVWCGSVIMLPNVFMGWDCEFYETDEEKYDSPREFILNSPTRNAMEEIQEIFINKRIKYWTRVHTDATREEIEEIQNCS